jgi:predicted ATPase with chaperone activity
MIQRYVSKISGPLMDRIDIHIDVPAVNYKEMRSTSEPESSAKIRERVIRARQKQLERFATSREKLYCNAQMSSRHIRTFCELSADCERLLERAMRALAQLWLFWVAPIVGAALAGVIYSRLFAEGPQKTVRAAERAR